MESIWPLEGCISSDPLQGGYAYLEWTGSVYHPGIDANTPGGAYADLGKAVMCPSPGMVAYRGFWDGVTKNEGNHIWIEHDDRTLTHYDHLLTVPVPEGTRLSRGAVFATCGSTGNSDYPHVHFEVWRGDLWGPPPSWTFWPKGQSREWIQSRYADPEPWLVQAKQRADLAAAANAANALKKGETMEQFSDAQLAIVAEGIWKDVGVPFNPDAAIVKLWVAELKAGRFRGTPQRAEVSDPDYGVTWQQFDGPALAVYADGKAAFAG